MHAWCLVSIRVDPGLLPLPSGGREDGAAGALGVFPRENGSFRSDAFSWLAFRVNEGQFSPTLLSIVTLPAKHSLRQLLWDPCGLYSQEVMEMDGWRSLLPSLLVGGISGVLCGCRAF